MRKVLEMLNEKTWVRSSRNWDVKEIELLNEHLLITAKPVIYLVNVGARDYIKKKNPWLSKIKQWIDANDPGATMVPFSAEFEEEISKMADEESLKYQEDNKTSSAIPKIIVSGFKTLKLEYFFTTGKDEVKAWTIQKGSKAPQAAGKIHTDFERGFISAEVMKFEDFKELGTEVAVKNAGKYRQEGKKYVVQDGDIIFFKFNVTQQPKKK
uniref:Obg-like ATPase 1 (Trinotate prediction) n=1 Tax=Myxobolus squamalis TaxID=59785 RepID=A0A6B2FY34_MYXSQ